MCIEVKLGVKRDQSWVKLGLNRGQDEMSTIGVRVRLGVKSRIQG